MTDIYAGIPTVAIHDVAELVLRLHRLPAPLKAIVDHSIIRTMCDGMRATDAVAFAKHILSAYEKDTIMPFLLYNGIRAANLIAVAELAVIVARDLRTVTHIVNFYRMTEEQRLTTAYAFYHDRGMAYALSYEDVSKAATQARWLVEYEERMKQEGKGE